MGVLDNLADVLRRHQAVWDHDESYDVPVRCECGWDDRYDPDGADVYDHIAQMIVLSGVRL